MNTFLLNVRTAFSTSKPAKVYPLSGAEHYAPVLLLVSAFCFIMTWVAANNAFYTHDMTGTYWMGATAFIAAGYAVKGSVSRGCRYWLAFATPITFIGVGVLFGWLVA